MNNNTLESLKFNQCKGSERFIHNCNGNEKSVLDFWKWAYSNLAANNLRGHLAEFIVASDLDVTQQPRIEWDDYDLLTKTGKRVEVKSAAFLQSWNQSKLSTIKFNISPSHPYNNKTGTRSDPVVRNSDVYVFCLLAHKNKQTLNPINLEQWDFYVLSTQTINQRLGPQKTITLNSLLKLKPAKCSYGEIEKTIDNTPLSN
ncbi:hypothetical protein [Crenobacter caeni]|uniref:Uncharacterized protein n=1 Tax=Crenobacter caeni TaxID=2705474 RepID=A0A6B2KR65_9NEIS|nr:hypothetical protein [Crenobacter caeni]NDV12726.1 hypothetical protein [Crenobacter caeni]